MAVSTRDSRTCRSAGGVLHSRRQSRLALTSLAWRTSNSEVQFLVPTCNGRLPVCEVRTTQNNWPGALVKCHSGSESSQVECSLGSIADTSSRLSPLTAQNLHPPRD